jgi:DNA-binding MarR family transcriptional regulator
MSARREEAIGEIIQSFRKILRTIDDFSAELRKKYNITGPQAGTLKIIAQNGPITLTDVCGRTFRHITTVGGIVDRLERGGYVVKKRDTQDRRKVLLAATPKGKRLASSAPFAGPVRAMNAMERLPTKEILKINESLGILAGILEEEMQDTVKGARGRKRQGSGIRGQGSGPTGHPRAAKVKGQRGC